eukprot:3941209-Rhodomonas_salina.1
MHVLYRDQYRTFARARTLACAVLIWRAVLPGNTHSPTPFSQRSTLGPMPIHLCSCYTMSGTDLLSDPSAATCKTEFSLTTSNWPS